VTGTVYSVAPIPPDPEHTTYIDAGAVSFGVEYRLLDDAELAANYQGTDMEEIQQALDGNQVEDNGVSIHVLGTDDGHEYLRFDCFEKGPHYHYIEPSGEKQTIVDFDEVAMGDMLRWTMVQLRTRLRPMLEYADGVALAQRIDDALVDSAVARLQVLADEARAELDAQRKG
jgi:hypothetical protein